MKAKQKKLTYRFGISSKKLNRSIYEFFPRNDINHLDSAKFANWFDAIGLYEISGRLDGEADIETEMQKDDGFLFVFSEQKIIWLMIKPE